MTVPPKVRKDLRGNWRVTDWPHNVKGGIGHWCIAPHALSVTWMWERDTMHALIRCTKTIALRNGRCGRSGACLRNQRYTTQGRIGSF
jgi:hypothetical protein